jgi:LPS sulfotransferase NodH
MTASFAELPLSVMRARFGTVRAYLKAFNSDPAEIPRFMIVTYGRAGSELLVSHLRTHPQILCDSELLGNRRLSPERLLEGRAIHARDTGRLAYGFKVKPKDIHEIQQFADAESWLNAMYARGWKIIRLHRINRLHQAISALRWTKQQGHYRKGEAKIYQPIAINPFEVMALVCTIGYYENQIDELLRGIEYLDLTYEADLQNAVDQDVTVTKICELLDIKPWSTTTDLVRISPTNTPDLVTNYDQIAAEIRRNRFAEYLND